MVTKTRQVAQRAKVEEGGGVALTGRMWWNLVVVTGLAGVSACVGQAYCTKSGTQTQGLGEPLHFVE